MICLGLDWGEAQKLKTVSLQNSKIMGLPESDKKIKMILKNW